MEYERQESYEARVVKALDKLEVQIQHGEAELQQAGFVDVNIEVTRRYSLTEIASSGASASVASLSSEERNAVDGRFISAFVRARKPETQNQ